MPSQRLLTKDDYYFPVGVFLEGAFWGVYTALFIAALWIWGKRRSRDGTPSSTFSRWLYLVLITLMWLVACAHLGTSIQRLLRIHVLEIRVGQKPHRKILDVTKWDNMAHILLMTAMVWLGDILVIYRTYVVWNRSVRVVALPMVVHMTYVVVNTLSIYGFSHPDRIEPKTAIAFYQTVFPLVFTQNVITTSLLTYKIYSTHRVSRKNGAANATSSGMMGLGSLSWMLIETAMLYTMELLVIIVLGALRHPAKAIASVLLVPTLGIVFVLLSVRVHFSGTSTTYNWPTPSKVPNILRDSTSGDDDAAAHLPSKGVQRAVTPLSLDGDIDMDILTLQRHSNDSDYGEEDRQSESFPVSISQRDSQE